MGKSLVAAMLATALNRKGYATAVLDADITGPSIPKIFGLKQKAAGNEEGLLPVQSKTGIKIMSINLLLPNATDPVIWRGPILAGVIKQFWSDVVWGEVDYLLIDMPPGTGDVPLTVFQSLPVDGIVIVTSPQELVSDIVSKAVKMARLMDIHIFGPGGKYGLLPVPPLWRGSEHLWRQLRVRQRLPSMDWMSWPACRWIRRLPGPATGAPLKTCREAGWKKSSGAWKRWTKKAL